jgi:hypothetical protein
MTPGLGELLVMLGIRSTLKTGSLSDISIGTYLSSTVYYQGVRIFQSPNKRSLWGTRGNIDHKVLAWLPMHPVLATESF